MGRDLEAIDRLRALEPPGGYWLAYSGGKDSVVVLDLARRAGVRFDAHHSLTTIDPPEVVRFVRSQGVSVERPRESFFALMSRKGPPTRLHRWCCAALKENGGLDRVVVTGVRAAESPRRAKRSMTERCYKGRRTFVHPIIDWSDDDVWGYIRDRGLAVCELYAEGFRRIGCIACPMAPKRERYAALARWPGFARAYRVTFARLVARNLGRPSYRAWPDGRAMMDWWLSGESVVRWSEGYEPDPDDIPPGVLVRPEVVEG